MGLGHSFLYLFFILPIYTHTSPTFPSFSAIFWIQYFFKTFYFEIIVNLQKSFKDSTEFSQILFIQPSLMLISYINMVAYLSKLRNSHRYNTINYTTDFVWIFPLVAFSVPGFHPIYHIWISHHVSLIPPGCGSVLDFSVFWWPVQFLRVLVRYFVDCLSILVYMMLAVG